MLTERRKRGSENAIREMVALRWEPTHVTKHSPRVVPLQILCSSLRFPCYNHLWRLSTPVSPGFAWIFLGFHATPLVLSCSLVWDLWNISLQPMLTEIITTYPTISAWSTRICLVFLTFIGSPLWCSQNSDHHFCLTTLLWTRQLCYSDNSSANSSLCQASMLNLGPLCPLRVSTPISISLFRPSPIDFFKSSSPLFHGLLALESRTVTLIY